jgi:hypothetical protein
MRWVVLASLLLVGSGHVPSWCKGLHQPDAAVCGSSESNSTIPEIQAPRPESSPQKAPQSDLGRKPLIDGTVAGTWKQFKIGGGGFVTRIEIAPNGAQVVRTDTAGGYYRASYSEPWRELITYQSMPAPDNGFGKFNGVCEIAIAPSNTNHLYMYYNPAAGVIKAAYIYTSINSGQTWARTGTSFPSSDICEPNDPAIPSARLKGPYMAVDPANENVVYVGTPSDGVYFTTNSGTTWKHVATAIIPGGTTPAGADMGQGSLIQFDPRSRVSNGQTQGIYISSFGRGIWHSTDGGGSWTALNSAGMPTTFGKLLVDQVGTVWVIDDPAGNQAGGLWRYKSGAWVEMIASTKLAGIAVNPADANIVYAVDWYGPLTFSTNGQADRPTWNAPPAEPPNAAVETSSVIGWMKWAQDYGGGKAIDIMSLAFDPSQSNVLYAAAGTGVFTTTPPIKRGPVLWNGDQTQGIENLATTWGFDIPGGPLFLTAADRPLWLTSNPEAYPSQYFPNTQYEINKGFQACSYRSTYIGITGRGMTVSTLSGADGTWSPYFYIPGQPNTAAGNCAIFSETSFVWRSDNNVGPYLTTDGGKTWNACIFNNGATAGGGGWGYVSGNGNIISNTLVQDTTNPNVLLLYNNGGGATNGPAAKGVWRSTGGCAFTQVYTNGLGGSSLGFNLQAVPGKACNFFAGGTAYIHLNGLPDTTVIISRTTDCGASWTRIANVESMFGWGLGAAKPGGDGYPTFYCACWVDNGSGYDYGIWESDDIDQRTPTWTKIGDGYPTGIYDQIMFIAPDINTYGTVYGGFYGSGYFYRTLN